jgi:hypothetical protein
MITVILIKMPTNNTVTSNIKIHLRETGCEDVDWIRLAQDRDQWWAVVNTVMNIPVP